MEACWFCGPGARKAQDGGLRTLTWGMLLYFHRSSTFNEDPQSRGRTSGYIINWLMGRRGYFPTPHVYILKASLSAPAIDSLERVQ